MLALGISIKNSYLQYLMIFTIAENPKIPLLSLGVDATHNFFKQNKYLDPF